MSLQNVFYILGVISFFVFLCIFAPVIAFIIGLAASIYSIFYFNTSRYISKIILFWFYDIISRLFIAAFFGLLYSALLMILYFLFWIFSDMKYTPFEAFLFSFGTTTFLSFLTQFNDFSLDDIYKKAAK